MRMLGKYAFLAALLAALSLTLFVSCPPPGDDDDDPPVYELDERLVGLKWEHAKPQSNSFWETEIPELGYYIFSEADDDSGDYFLTVHDTPEYPDYFPLEEDVPYSVYSKNGFIYLKDTKTKIMQYQFHDEWPFQEFSTFRENIIEAIERGRIAIITYRLYEEDGYEWDDGRDSEHWLLRWRGN